MIRGVRIRTGWEAIQDSLLVLKPKGAAQKATGERLRIAGFDFDDTLVRKHDNTLSYKNVVEYLRALYDAGFTLAIMSNETVDHMKNPDSIKRALEKKALRIETFLNTLGVPMYSFVATRYDAFRKPSTKDGAKKKPPGGRKMWDTLINLLEVDEDGMDMDGSFFVGDSAGRGGDFSDADLAFAKTVGMRFIHSDDFFRKPLPSFATASSSATETVVSTSVEVLEERVTTKESVSESVVESTTKRAKVISLIDDDDGKKETAKDITKQ